MPLIFPTSNLISSCSDCSDQPLRLFFTPNIQAYINPAQGILSLRTKIRFQAHFAVVGAYAPVKREENNVTTLQHFYSD